MVLDLFFLLHYVFFLMFGETHVFTRFFHCLSWRHKHVLKFFLRESVADLLGWWVGGLLGNLGVLLCFFFLLCWSGGDIIPKDQSGAAVDKSSLSGSGVFCSSLRARIQYDSESHVEAGSPGSEMNAWDLRKERFTWTLVSI